MSCECEKRGGRFPKLLEIDVKLIISSSEDRSCQHCGFICEKPIWNGQVSEKGKITAHFIWLCNKCDKEWVLRDDR